MAHGISGNGLDKCPARHRHCLRQRGAFLLARGDPAAKPSRTSPTGSPRRWRGRRILRVSRAWQGLTQGLGRQQEFLWTRRMHATKTADGAAAV